MRLTMRFFEAYRPEQTSRLCNLSHYFYKSQQPSMCPHSSTWTDENTQVVQFFAVRFDVLFLDSKRMPWPY